MSRFRQFGTVGRPAGVPDRRAFTLVECLAVITVMGILAAILLPAIAASREAARRTHCMNNLKQIGLALHQYLGVNNVFPRGVGGNGYSFLASILPHLDQTALYDSLNVSLPAPIARAENQTAARSPLGVLQCPSDGSTIAGANYAGNWSAGYRGYPSRGAFPGPFSPSFGLEAVTDGSSRTVMAAEWLTGGRSPGDRDERRTVFVMDLSPGNYGGLLEHCRSRPVDGGVLHINDKGYPWIRGGYPYTMYNHGYTINGRSCSINGSLLDGIYSASSNHGGGANCLFMDGRVRHVRASVSLEVWRALGSRNGGETVAED